MANPNAYIDRPTSRLIAMFMKRANVKYDDICDEIDMTKDTFANKMNRDSWRPHELFRILYFLMSEEEKEKILPLVNFYKEGGKWQ